MPEDNIPVTKIKIDITSTVVEKGMDAVKEFLQKLIGPPIDEIGLLLADNVKLWRFKNQIRIVQKADNYIKSKNIKIKQVPLKILAPLLEGASLEEEEELQDKWAALLVNYVDSKQNLKTTVFPYILTQISSNEAKALEYIANARKGRELPFSNNLVSSEEVSEKYEISDAEISNLIRLGLIKIVELTSQDYADIFSGTISPKVVLSSVPDLKVTGLGINFLEACKVED